MKLPKIQQIYDGLSHLPKRQRAVLYFTVCFVLLAVIDRLIIYPVSYRIGSLNKEIKEKEAGIKKDLRILSMKNKIVNERSKYSSFFYSAKSEEEEYTIIYKEVENLANRSSVYLIDIKPGGVKEAGSAKKFLINLNFEAQMEQLVDFMYNIENSAQLLIIEKFQISPKSIESSVARCTMVVSKIALP
ncbi:MAG: hypothetical protein NT066_02490 [Candidatus Omnitrophica bacterium]|nr:hypothetical protein [Candidatus Omnitrophota bacterium]